MIPARLRATVVVAGLTMAVTGHAQHAKRTSASTVAALESWVHAVRTHTSGLVDEAVVSTASLSYATREEMNAGMPLFLAGLAGKVVVTDISNETEHLVVMTGRQAGNPDAGTFLKHAAMLHTDVAVHTDGLPLQTTGADQPAGAPRVQERQVGGGTARLPADAPVPPLLTANRVVLTQDGRVLGATASSWNWPFARSLVDVLNDRGGAAPFVSAWYHATTAYMFANGLYGDARPHLRRAAELLPEEAWSLFDRGCYAELLGLPMHQALVSEKDVIDRRLMTAPGFRSSRTMSGAPPSLNIPPAENTNAEAERLFRRALAAEPSLTEARVRMARLLEVRKDYKEALNELDAALAAKPQGVVAFYADLFAARAARAVGRTGEASRHVRDALARFPDAQSALLTASQIALLEAEVPAALTAVERLGPTSAVFTADPWWQYHLGAGRDAEPLLRALWTGLEPH